MKEYINQIICGDCLEVMKDWPDGCVDLVITSPPYNINKDYESYEDKKDWKNFMLWNLDVRQELLRVSDNTVYIIGSHNNFEFLSNIRLEPIAEMKTIILPTWSIVNPVEVAVYEFNNRDKWSKQHNMPIVCNGAISTYLPCVVGSANNDTLYDKHPCTFPERFPEAFISSLSLNDEIIFDPLCGSGTTCVAAKRLGRRYIGIDISEEYCQIARERLKSIDTGVPVKEARAGQKGLFE